MRKTTKLGLLGAVTTAVLLSGCGDDRGRAWAMSPQDDYLPDRPEVKLGEGTATGGAGSAMAPGIQDGLWLRQDFRVPYPPAQMEALVAPNLGTGKALRANAQGVWVQGLYSLEVGSGITGQLAPESAPYQPQARPVGEFLTPRSLPESNTGN